jgi:alkylation response protein AidB-like acyl-CoA dehydrogenase
MKVPAALGGGEADVPAQIDTIEALAYIDAAAAWCVMVGATAIAWPGAFLADDAVDEVFAANRIPLAAVAVQPAGTALKTAGGYRVSGRWSFASGIRHADWIVAGASLPQPTGVARTVMVVLPQRDVTIQNDWDSVGLRGTGSASFVVDDVFVRDGFSWSFPYARPRRGGALFKLGWPGFVVHEPAAFALGLGQRMLDELIAQQQQQRLGSASGGRDLVHRRVALAELRLKSASALTREVFSGAWDVVCRGGLPAPRLQAQMRSVAAFATDAAIEVADVAFRQSGSRVVYRSGMLQRCFRDLHTAAQHWLVRDTAYGVYGQFLLGVPDADPLADAR